MFMAIYIYIYIPVYYGGPNPPLYKTFALCYHLLCKIVEQIVKSWSKL